MRLLALQNKKKTVGVHDLLSLISKIATENPLQYITNNANYEHSSISGLSSPSAFLVNKCSQ